MKITIYDQSGLTLVYLYFYSREKCIELNNGGEADLTCKLLFDSENEWLGLSFISENVIEDSLEPSSTVTIKQLDGEWTILFRTDKTIFREEIHGCITDLHNNKYTGIELILNEGTIPKRQYTERLMYNR